VKSLVCSHAIHAALKSDPIAWSMLPLIGVQRFEANEDEPASALEMRNCHCNSTLCKEVSP
jgi:hypothetical protein